MGIILNQNNSIFIIHKTQLKSYSKKQFDPFCRRDRIEFKINDESIISTLGSIKFF